MQKRIQVATNAVVKILVDGTPSGTGFVVSDGLIATDFHVVQQITPSANGQAQIGYSPKIAIQVQGGVPVPATPHASVLGPGLPEAIGKDVALLSAPTPGVEPLRLGHFSDIHEGDSVYVVGYPLGVEQVIVSRGMLSTKWKTAGYLYYPSTLKENFMKMYKKSEDAVANLTPEQHRVTQQGGTERPGTGEYLHNHAPGIYVDIVSGEPLFASSDKFESGCGWPSFTKPIEPAYINELRDTSHGMIRTEVRSIHGDSHLGHVFPDGPQDRGGLRYCINSASLRFIHRDDMEEEGYGGYLNQVVGK